VPLVHFLPKILVPFVGIIRNQDLGTRCIHVVASRPSQLTEQGSRGIYIYIYIYIYI
jgi:hypothetical protein